MKQIFCILFLLATNLTLCSQNIVNTLPSAYANVKNSFTLVDNDTQDYYLFLQTSGSLIAYQYSETHELKSNVQVYNLDKEFSNIVGSFIDGESVHLITSKNHKTFSAITFYFNTEKFKLSSLDVKLKGDHLTTITRKNGVYILAIPSRTSALEILNFGPSLIATAKTIQFEKGTFKDHMDRSINFSKITSVLVSVDYLRADVAIISDGDGSDLLSNSNPIKIYTNKSSNDITVTIDKYPVITYLIDINLDGATHKVSKVEKPKLEILSGAKTNSLLFEDKLFQVAANTDEFKFIVKEYPSLAILKEYNVGKKENITFKNTPITLEGGSFESSRVLEKTAQFLRKITDDYPAIAITKAEEEYSVIFGTEVLLKQMDAGTMALALGGGLVGGLIGAAISSSSPKNISSMGLPVRRIEFTSKFDANFNHIPGVLDAANDFDMDIIIPSYFINKKDIAAQTLFKVDSRLYVGYFHKKQKKYFVSGLN